MVAQVPLTRRRRPPPVRIQHYRVRTDKIDTTGAVTLRHNSRLRHIGIGRADAGKRVTLPAAGFHIRIITEHGQLLRELTFDPSRDYQPQHKT